MKRLKDSIVHLCDWAIPMHGTNRGALRSYILLALSWYLLACREGFSDRPNQIEIGRKDSIVVRLASAHNSVIEGKVHINYLFVTFAEEVFRQDTVRYYELRDILPEHQQLKQYLSNIGDVIIQKSFPKSLWGDTVRTNRTGETVSVPNLARHFRIFFPRPMSEREVMDSLRSFPEIQEVGGPAWRVPE